MKTDIDPAGVGRVLTAAGEQVAGYEDDLTTVDDAMSSLGVALTHSPLVADRLGEFGGEVGGRHLRKVVGHSGSALQGTAEAALAYQDGDERMQARAQVNATRARYPTAPGGHHADGVGSGVPR